MKNANHTKSNTSAYLTNNPNVLININLFRKINLIICLNFLE